MRKITTPGIIKSLICTLVAIVSVNVRGHIYCCWNSHIYPKIHIIAESIGSNILANIIFPVLIVWGYVILYKWLYAVKKNIYLLTLWLTLCIVIFYANPKVFSSLPLIDVSYQLIWIVFALLLFVLEFAKYFDWLITPDDEVQSQTAQRGMDFSHVLIGSDTNPKDLLGRKAEVEAVYEYLTTNMYARESSLAIAVTGSWGSGKTTFLNFMKDCFARDGITYFHYSPWNRTDSSVVLDFMNHLSERLSKDGVFSKSLDLYIRSLKTTNLTGWFPLVLQSLTFFYGQVSASTQTNLKRIREDMRGLKNPIIAIIDDVDRVSALDFRDVLGLIRSTADFPNLVYVVAYDTARAEELLKDCGGSQYLAKIFNLTHSLLPVEEDTMQFVMLEVINNSILHRKDALPSDSPFVDVTLTDYLPTLRDLYRFTNMLCKDYSVQADMRQETSFDLEYWCTLELLKFHNPVVWSILRTEPSKYLVAPHEMWNETVRYRLKDADGVNDILLKRLLLKLFDNVNPDVLCSSPEVFQTLFMNSLDTTYLKKSDFYKAIKDRNIAKMLPIWKNLNNTFSMLLSYDHFSADEIVKICSTLAYDETPIGFLADLNMGINIDSGFVTITQPLFSHIRKHISPYTFVEQHHELHLMMDKFVRDHNGKGIEEMTTAILKAEDIRAMLAVVYGWEQVDLCQNTLPEKWKVSIFLKLVQRLIDETDMNDLKNQYYVMEAVEYGHVYDPVNMFVKPLIKNKLSLWLRLTTFTVDTFDEHLMMLDMDVMRTMFDTYDTYKESMEALKAEYKEALNNAQGEEKAHLMDSLAVLDEHMDLTKKMELVGAYSKATFNSDRYPLLYKYRCIDTGGLYYQMPTYDEITDRFRKKNVPFYYGESRHPQLFE